MRTYKITEKQLEKLKTITEKLKIDGLKAARPPKKKAYTSHI